MLFRARTHLNLYDSPDLTRLATQVAAGGHLELLTSSVAAAIAVRLCADGYGGWLAAADVAQLEPAHHFAPAPPLSAAEICDRLPLVIAFTQAAMAVPNTYLWGGTVAPNYDCSGLMQAAFLAAAIQLPRDAYQQEAFVQPIARADCLPGDLIFFGPLVKATHVALCLGDDRYIHSSGQDQGRNGIGIDVLSPHDHAVSRAYYAQLRGVGRVVTSYRPA